MEGKSELQDLSRHISLAGYLCFPIIAFLALATSLGENSGPVTSGDFLFNRVILGIWIIYAAASFLLALNPKIAAKIQLARRSIFRLYFLIPFALTAIVHFTWRS
jgi:hypothetical protein